MMRFKGTGVALVTPFDENQEVDKDSLVRLVKHVIEGGVDFLVVLGTTAETATLSPDEKAEVAAIVVHENRGRLPLMAGVGGNNTREVVKELKEYDWLKHFQGVLSITPFYNKPNQAGLIEHFSRVAAASPLPLCLYNVPGRTGVNMSASTITKLAAECSNIIALKEASGCMDQATAILRDKRADFTLLSGDDSLTLPLMSLGFEGVVSVMANIMPAACANMVNSVRSGNYLEAQKLHLSLSLLCRALFEEGNPAGVKAALHAAGIIRHNVLRSPLTSVSPELYARIREYISRF